jgi:hypothetical protein
MIILSWVHERVHLSNTCCAFNALHCMHVNSLVVVLLLGHWNALMLFSEIVACRFVAFAVVAVHFLQRSMRSRICEETRISCLSKTLT